MYLPTHYKKNMTTTILDLTVGELYTLVFNDRGQPNEIIAVFEKYHQTPYVPRQYRKSMAVEPDYEITTDYLFVDHADPDREYRVENWKVKDGMVEIFPMDIPIK